MGKWIIRNKLENIDMIILASIESIICEKHGLEMNELVKGFLGVD